MGQRFRQETEYSQHVGENPEQMAMLGAKLIEGNGLLISERNGVVVGMIGYIVFPHFISGEIVAGEVFWWVEPEHRGEGPKLLREAEKRVAAAGAKRMQMIAPNERVGKLYERFGYSFVESTYQRTLGV
jgi:GNAT superfamily N-acetyltransferase